jgi:hypothetical protein
MPESPQTMSGTTAGIRRLLRWLDFNAHTGIPFASVDYVGNDSVEMTLISGGYDVLAAAITVSEALSDSEIAVAADSSLDGQRHWCQLTITGAIGVGEDALDVIVAGICYDEAATALRNSLGTPPIPGEKTWPTTVDHLASLLPPGVL